MPFTTNIICAQYKLVLLLGHPLGIIIFSCNEIVWLEVVPKFLGLNLPLQELDTTNAEALSMFVSG